MKRLYFAIVLAVILVLVIGLGTYFVTKANSDMNIMLEKIQQAVLNEEINTATRLCIQIENKWFFYEKKLRFFVDNSEICEIGVEISTLKQLIKKQEKAELLSAMETIKIKLTHLAAMEKIYK